MFQGAKLPVSNPPFVIASVEQTVAVAVGSTGVSVGTGVPQLLAGVKISIEAIGVPAEPYPPASHTLPVAGSLSAGKLRRAVVNAGPRLHVFVPGSRTSTSLDG